MSRSYLEWLHDAPDSYKHDGFFVHRRPVAVTSRYGQNQQIGSNEANSEVEDRNWDNDRPWDELSHVTIALATHIR